MKGKSIIQENRLKKYASKYVLDKYETCFDDDLAKKYVPIIYENGCLSGPPSGVYYRIVINPRPRRYCIQYYYYWKKQLCFSSHGHDYEPILVFLDDVHSFPYCIVNNGFSKDIRTNFHKLEIRPLTGKRSPWLKNSKTTITKSPEYPFGKSGKKKHTVWYKKYPLQNKRGKLLDDLTFANNRRAKFGIPNCSNVFSGSRSSLKKRTFDPVKKRSFDPPLRRLTDKTLEKWYKNHYKKSSDMPFGHDVASPFKFPFSNYQDARPHLPEPRENLFSF